jgi:hypothetical protein
VAAPVEVRDRAGQFTEAFDAVLAGGGYRGVKIPLPYRLTVPTETVPTRAVAIPRQSMLRDSLLNQAVPR